MKAAFFCLLALLFGLALGLMINVQVMGDVLFATPKQSGALTTAQPGTDKQTNSQYNLDAAVTTPDTTTTVKALDGSNIILLTRAYAVLDAMRAQDYSSLSTFVHPEDGVTFTPYSFVDRSSDRTFRPLELSKAKSNTTVYIWGLWVGSGAPIQYTLTEYFSDFVYNADFMNASLLGINQVISSGNSLENVAVAYPEASFVEFYLPGVNPDFGGMDWCGLKLVFEPYQGEYMLVGVIHSEWTI